MLLLAAPLLLLGAHDGPAWQGSPQADGLYAAYNQLAAFSQQCQLPIKTPQIVVVGQQTDGKSALIEALMGFQFNHVGGGTKTRRPIALQMQYRAECEEPRCFLFEGGRERQVGLQELKAYIEAENSRLEAEGAFEAEELIVRMDYKCYATPASRPSRSLCREMRAVSTDPRLLSPPAPPNHRYCPNLSIIDTPGLLDFDSAAQSTAPSAATNARAVRELVVAQMSAAERVILCVEETRCWQSSAARERSREVAETRRDVARGERGTERS